MIFQVAQLELNVGSSVTWDPRRNTAWLKCLAAATLRQSCVWQFAHTMLGAALLMLLQEIARAGMLLRGQSALTHVYSLWCIENDLE